MLRSFVISAALLFSLAECVADEEVVSDTVAIAGGRLTVITHAMAPRDSVLVHFHGAPETVASACRRTQLSADVVVLNFPGLSSAYSKPIAADRNLLERVLKHAVDIVQRQTGKSPQWQRRYLSSFSAGYGAIREILKSPNAIDRIDGIVAADSIYAGLEPDSVARRVSEENMHEFLQFATAAAHGKKSFVLSHSAQTTPYASTTETSDYLLRSLQISREAVDATEPSRPELRLTSRAQRSRFEVLGYAGATAEDHMRHLSFIDLYWDILGDHEEKRLQQSPNRGLLAEP